MRCFASAIPALALALIVGVQSAEATAIASTNFDGHGLATTDVANDTATNLNWTLDGIDDPGNIQAKLANLGGSVALFSGNTTVDNIFAPAYNTGNNDSYWQIDIPLTVAAGYVVTLTDVSFNYWAINSGKVLNVNRRADFLVQLFNPSGVAIESELIADVVSGTTANPATPLVTVPLSQPRLLDLPGTYRLNIWGGDFSGANETGNHTAIDNLSINGDVSVVPEPATLAIGLMGITIIASRRRR